MAGLVMIGVGLVARVTTAADVPDFNREIRPILSRNCFACHGPDEHDRRGGLRLDDRAAATRELESGLTAIVPGKPAESELVARLHATDADIVMPPPESNHVLTPAQKQLLERWIAAGAPYAAHWAYAPPAATPDPAVKDPAWARTWIDRFVLARLEAEGLMPAPDADKITLLRRATFDLTGLPPTPAEVDEYLADTRPDSYVALIDRLLASPRHAERLAAWWLDLVRYADTVGYHGDQTHAASPYRDWVIAAFLANVPFDRFTILQLAGDLVEPLPGEHPDDRVLAAAYNRLLQTTHEGGLQVKEYRAIYQADRIRNVSGVWMGATVGCAQCHDHKYDPYTARDFYALGSFFADIDDEKHMGNAGFGGAPNALPTTRLPERPLVGPFDRDRAAALDSEIAALRQTLPPKPDDKPGKKTPAKPAAASKDDRLAKDTASSANGDKPGESPAPPPEPPEVVAKRQRLAALEAERKQLTRSLMVTQALPEPRTVRVLSRGNWMDESGEVVMPAIPAFMGVLPTSGRATRADLARWLVRPVAEGGVGELTARVTANRLWAVFFGAGLCRSAGDFGGQGEPPRPPGPARPVGVGTGRRLGRPQAHPHDRDEPRLPAVVRRVAGTARPRSRQPAARKAGPLAVSGRGRPRRGAPGKRPARRTARRRERASLPAGRLLPAPQLPAAGVQGRRRRPPVAPGPVRALAADVSPSATPGLRRAHPRGVHGDAVSLEHAQSRARAPERPHLRRGGPGPRRAGAQGGRRRPGPDRRPVAARRLPPAGRPRTQARDGSARPPPR